MSVLSLEPIPGKIWKPDELEALRARAVDAIEDYLDTSRFEIQWQGSSGIEELIREPSRNFLKTGNAALGIDSGNLIVSDAMENVRRVDSFLKSLGFVGSGGFQFPTPMPTSTTQRRPVS